MNMIWALMMITSSNARVMSAPAPAVDTTRPETAVKFIKSCDAMKVSFLEYQGDKAYCGRIDWDGIVSAYSSDFSTIQPNIYVSDDISYLKMNMSYTDTYVILEGSDVMFNDDVYYVDTLENVLKRNTNAKSFCNRIAKTGGGNVYRLTEGTTEIKICGSTIDTIPPPSLSSPPPPPSSSSPPPQSSTGGVPLGAIIGASIGAFVASLLHWS